MKSTNYFDLAKEDWQNVNFGDKRLNKRAEDIGASFLENPFVSPPKMLKKPKKTKAFYRFMNSDNITHEKLIDSHIKETCKEIDDNKIVLAIHDLTTLTFKRNYEIEGLYDVGGHQDNPSLGIVVHNSISVTPHESYGTINGLLNQTIHKSKPKEQRNKENNETSLWLNGIESVGKPSKDTTIIDVMDRGADIIEVMECSLNSEHEFIIRAMYNRRLNGKKGPNLFDVTKALPIAGYKTLEIQANKGRKKRKAKLKISFSNITLPPPEKKKYIEPIECAIIHVAEVDCPDNQKPIEWFLLTSLEIKDFQGTLKIINYYSYRWIIEEYHKCMKTGFKLEQTQLHTLKRIENLLGFVAVSSVSLLKLRDIVKHNPEAKAREYVEEEDLNIVRAYYKLEKKEMNIDQFLRYIAQMGGFLNRKSDGNPGWQSLWEGWKFFLGLKEGVRLQKGGLICG